MTNRVQLTDASNNPYSDSNPLPTKVDVTVAEPADTFGNAATITAATTFSGVPTISQLVANSSALLANPGSMATFIAEIAVASAFVGTLSFYGLEPDGATLQLISAHQRNATTIANSTAISTAVALNQTWMGSAANFKTIYVVCTAFTSGSVLVQLGLSAAPYALVILNTINALITNGNSNGQAIKNNSAPVIPASDWFGPIQIADGTTPSQKAAVDVSGNMSVKVGSALPAGTNLIGYIGRSSVALFTTTQTTTGTGDSSDLAVGPYTEISIDITTSAQAGTNPTIQFFWKRKGADGLYYPLWQSAVLSAAANTISTSIGAGMAYNQSLGLTGKLTWTVGGTATPTWTFTPNIYGK